MNQNKGGPSGPSRIRKAGIFFRGFHGKRLKPYPAWRYHDFCEPKLVNNTDEDQQASDAGWKEINPIMSHDVPIMNCKYDLEDMSARQLSLFAKEEFDVDLPPDAGKEKLFKAIWKLSMNAPQNRDAIVLMAQTIEMNYDEVQDEIREMIKDASDVRTEEFYA